MSEQHHQHQTGHAIPIHPSPPLQRPLSHQRSGESQSAPDEPLPLSLPAPQSAGGCGFYPPRLVKHDEVVANRDLFFDTLNKFHLALGTKFMVPTIGGKELDLHLLYIEVTARGGLDNGLYSEMSLKDICNDSKHREMVAEDLLCCICGCEDNEDHEAMASFLC